MKSRKALLDVLEDVSHTLKRMAGGGCTGFDCPPQTLAILSGWGEKEQNTEALLEEIRNDLGDCRRCPLAQSRTRIVFGDGDPEARLMFVGEGPGFEEDQQGLPFVGPAGQLLTKIIQAIGQARSRVYICNVVKCRPPQNRNPNPEEIETCFPFLERQIAAIKPHFICALGTYAAQTLLQSGQPISRLRGRLHERKGVRVLATYHPAYLLRNPERKRAVWEDMQLLMRAMEHA